jgi:hypothetical protein
MGPKLTPAAFSKTRPVVVSVQQSHHSFRLFAETVAGIVDANQESALQELLLAAACAYAHL